MVAVLEERHRMRQQMEKATWWWVVAARKLALSIELMSVISVRAAANLKTHHLPSPRYISRAGEGGYLGSKLILLDTQKLY